MEKEISSHNQQHHWKIVPKTKARRTKIIKVNWSFKRKRAPNGEITKHKACICAHGGMQRWGESYFETCTPVVNQLSVRLLLTLSIVMHLETHSINFTIAYPQANLKTRVFMEIPWGYEILDKDNSKAFCMELLTNWCRLKDAGLNQYECIKTGLENRSFTQSQIDPCLFTCGSLVVVLYVDNVIIIAKYSSSITNLLRSLKDSSEIDIAKSTGKYKKFSFTDNGSIKTFLGV